MNRSNSKGSTSPTTPKSQKKVAKLSTKRRQSKSPLLEQSNSISTSTTPSNIKSSSNVNAVNNSPLRKSSSRSMAITTKFTSQSTSLSTSSLPQPQYQSTQSISTSSSQLRKHRSTSLPINQSFALSSLPSPLHTVHTHQFLSSSPFTLHKEHFTVKSHSVKKNNKSKSKSAPPRTTQSTLRKSIFSIFTQLFSTKLSTDDSVPNSTTTPTTTTAKTATSVDPIQSSSSSSGFAASTVKLTKLQQEAAEAAALTQHLHSTQVSSQYSNAVHLKTVDSSEEADFQNERGSQGLKFRQRLTVDGAVDSIDSETDSTAKINRAKKQSQFQEMWEQFDDKHPFIARWLRRFFKTIKYTGMTLMFISCLAAVTTQVLAYPMIAQPAKEMLQWESATCLAASVEQMAALGLIDLKLMPQSVLDAMANPDNLKFGKDPSVIIEAPEMGYFINSAQVFGDRTVVSSDALPRHFDPVSQTEPAVDSYIMREAARDQFISLTKSMFEIADYGSQQVMTKLQLLPVLLNGYLGLLYDNPQALQITSFTGQSILLPVERIVDILYLRDNGMNESFNEIVKSYPPEVFQNKRALEHGSHPHSYEIGAQIQHYTTNTKSPVGAMLQKLDDRFIKELRVPEPDSPFIQDSPFKAELINIPEDIKNHPDRTVTGPLFQYYYNIFSRNAYTNVLIEENKVLVAMRDQLAQISDMVGLTRPTQLISGQSREQLSDPSLTPYTAFFKESVQAKVEATTSYPSEVPLHEISKTALNQTPLTRQPFHHFYSTGGAIKDSRLTIPRFFKDLTPFSTAATDIVLTPLLGSASDVKHQLFPKPEVASHIERFITTPRNLDASNHFNIDTSSVFKFTKTNDVMNPEWGAFNALPPRYTFSDDLQLNPQVPIDDVFILQRILTKLETTILRNQFELDRIKDVAGEMNPDYAIHRAQKEEMLVKQAQMMEEMMMEFQRQQEAALLAGTEPEKAPAAWYQIW